MRNTFELRPGTVAFRAIAHLETLPEGTEVMTTRLAEAIGVPPLHLPPCLEAALRHGKIFRRQRDQHARSPYWWSLTDHSARPRVPVAKVLMPELEIPVFRDARTADVRSAADGSQKPNGETIVEVRPAKAGSEIPEGQTPQHVLKAEAARPDATDRGESADASPGGGPMGAGQPAAAGPAGELRIALWNDGVLEIHRRPGDVVTLNADESRQLLAYLESTTR